MIADRVIAHRGGASLGPENTLAPVRLLPALGVRWIEVDVQLLDDGTPVVFHDRTLDRCTDGSGELTGRTWPEVSRLDAGSWFSDRHAGERVPRLTELLQFCARNELSINLELKSYRAERNRALIDAVLAAIAAAAFPANRLLLSSFDPAVLAALGARRTASPLGLVCEQVPQDLVGVAADLALASLHPRWDLLDRETVARVRVLGLEIYAWTADDPATFAPLWQWGVHGAITDRPQDFAGLVRR